MIKPLPGYVLIEPLEEEEKSSGGVFLPESSKDKPSKGKVVAVGAGKRIHTDLLDGEEMPPIMEGQTVIYKKWVNETINESGKEYLFVRFEDLLGVIE